MTAADSNAQNPVENSEPTPNRPLFFISAGDPSGDVHAARLVAALEKRFPGARLIGYAGPKTAATACDVRADLTKYAVMWIGRALLNLPNYLRLLKNADKIFRDERPDAVILVDFPGFNWKIAKKAKAAGIPTIYFMPPQIWGWAQWRVKKMRRFVDLALACFPFEDAWFRENGCRSTLVGHPFFEETRSKTVDADFLASLNSTENGASTPLSPEEIAKNDANSPNSGKTRYLTLLPGSRNQEVTGNVADLIATAEKVRAAAPDVRPVFAAFRDAHADFIRAELAKRGLDYPVFVGKTPELMRAATCCLAVSGSVSIELLALCKPTVVHYRVGKPQFAALRYIKRVKYITLTNLLAVDKIPGESPFYPKGKLAPSSEHTPRERELALFPEFISAEDKTDDAAAFLIDWFNDPIKRNERVAALAKLREETDFIDSPIALAAEKIAEELNRNQNPNE